MFGFSVYDLLEKKKGRRQHVDEKETEIKALGIVLRLLLRSAALLSVSVPFMNFFSLNYSTMWRRFRVSENKTIVNHIKKEGDRLR